MRGNRRTTLAPLLALVALALAAPSAIARGDDHHRHGKKTPRTPVGVQLLGLNDFHGNLEPPSGSSGSIAGTTAGGVEYLATHIRTLEASNRNTLVVSAGDLIGASPLLSAAFHDEPTIEAMNKLGLDLNAVGNHEFDEGEAELRRMAAGGCHPTDGCQDGDGFGGAEFGFLAANVVDRDSGRPLFAPYAIREFDGERIGFIGMTLEGTPDIVSPGGIANLRFLDEADTANRYARRLHRRGVEAIVVLLHEGGVQDPASSPINECNGISGPIVDIVRRTTPAVDLFVTGHTHQPYRCLLPARGRRGAPGPLRAVTSASSFGRLVTDIDLQIDRRSGDVVHGTLMAENRIVARTVDGTDVMRAPDMTALIQRYTTLVAPIRDEVIGRSTAVISRNTAPDGGDESPAGNLIADAQLAASSSPATGGAVAAFMNPGGVRADFPAGDISYGAAFNVQPFGNNLVTITLTGEQLHRMLKHQWCGLPSRRVLQPSDSVRYTYDPAKAIVGPAPAGTPCAGAPDDVVSTFTIDGQPVPRDASRSYRITVNSFLADGGDGFPVLREGTDRLGGEVDTKALQDYIRPSLTGAPIAPPATSRISRATP
jgi:5'-nucleotidase